MRELNIDVETWSDIDIKLGLTKYSQGSELLLLAYSLDNKQVRVIDIAQGEEIPQEFLDALFDPAVIKKAWNAAFEIEQLEKHLFCEFDLSQWQCTMVRAARCGYPLSLEEAAKAMGISAQKDTKGKALIKLFSVPRKPTKTNPATRVYPADNPEKWAEYKQYNKQDVIVEKMIDKFLSKYPDTTDFEKRMYVLDRKINRKGIELDLPFIDKAIRLDAEYKSELKKQAIKLSGLENPNSVLQIKSWFMEKCGVAPLNIDKNILKDLMEERPVFVSNIVYHYQGSESYDRLIAESNTPDDYRPEYLEQEIELEEPVVIKLDDELRAFLNFRKELSNTSVRKYVAMRKSEVSGRIYDTIQFNGAARTGRNAGRLIQPQNLPRIYMSSEELDIAREFVKNNELDMLEMAYPSVSGVLSQLIRTALIAKDGHHLKVADLSAIEARVLAWFADEEHVLEVFRTHGKIYEATAAMMFGVEIHSVTKDSIMRQRGKVASLACGYQGGPNAITTMDLDKSIPDAEKPGLVKAWREAHPNIVKFWYKAQNCAIKAVQNPGEKIQLAKGAYFVTCADALLFYLPSGRYLMYPKVELREGKYGPEITFMGMEQTTRKWLRQSTYGGKLVENLVQATARDVLMVGMDNIDKAGYDLVTNVHDETASETPLDFGSIEEVEELMCRMPAWTEGLPLGAEGFVSPYYKK